MKKLMIYHILAVTASGNIEKVWGVEMLTQVIDESQLEKAKADGWHTHPQAVIDEMEAKKLQAENKTLQQVLDSAENEKATERIAELEAELNKQKQLNSDLSAICTMNKDDLKQWLSEKEVSFGGRDSEDTLREKAVNLIKGEDDTTSSDEND